MSVQETIRKLDSEGISGRKIAVQLNLSRATVAKYLSITNYSPAPPRTGQRSAGSVITGFEETISTWLEGDRGRPRKQRHTAQRVFDRLVDEENYQGTYSPVQRFVKRYKQERQSDNDGFLELDWAPGTIQVDFGEAEVILNG
ncbi:helix-turn-helix domain-containing protein, partial [Glutamicibacter ardleyensis]|uniref:helix-turn-helix domain-containing protein n=1 Tax=Glutamicibacter ardleyensis TaxID=225894 RepID=UPI003FD3DC13